MSSIRKGLAASFIGKFWTTLISFILLPFYIKIIGLEAYGLVGIYTALLSLFQVLDLGLSTSINREMARMSAQNDVPENFGNLTRTLEIVYWSVALSIGIIIFLMAPLIADHWVNAKLLSSTTIKQAIYCIGLSLAFLWPSSLYNGGLMGLQNQVLLNSITMTMATLRGVGMLVILNFISPTIQAFFLWQTVINLLQTTLTGYFLWRKLPKRSVPARFDWALLLRLKKFAVGMTGLTIVAIIYSQLDKVFLSRLLSLEMFGYYTLATTIAGALAHIVVPIYSVFFPRFNHYISSNAIHRGIQKLVDGNGGASDLQQAQPLAKQGLCKHKLDGASCKDEDADEASDQFSNHDVYTDRLKDVYHLGCQIMSALILPTAFLVILFAPELIVLWTHNPETALNTSLLARLLTAGAMLNALLNLPSALQIAHGWVKLNLYLCLGAALATVPCLYWGIRHFGALGAAWTSVLINGCLLFFSVQIMHQRILKQEKWRWWALDVGLPLLATSAIVYIGRFFFPTQPTSPLLSFFLLGGIFIVSLACSILVSPHLRRKMIQGFLKWQRATDV